MAGPFTVESLSPHRTLGVDENDELIDPFDSRRSAAGASTLAQGQTFEQMMATGKGNLFVIFGEPDIDILHLDDGTLRVHVKGVDVFDPTTGEVASAAAKGR